MDVELWKYLIERMTGEEEENGLFRLYDYVTIQFNETSVTCTFKPPRGKVLSETLAYEDKFAEICVKGTLFLAKFLMNVEPMSYNTRPIFLYNCLTDGYLHFIEHGVIHCNKEDIHRDYQIFCNDLERYEKEFC